MPKSYRPWAPEQPFLLPPDPRAWLPDDHVAHFVLEVVDRPDVSAIKDAIQAKDARGERPYSPRMMLALLVYGYCTGVFSSRKMERRTYEDVAFRFLAAGQHPSFSTICEFRRRHLDAIAALFVQISRRAGLATLGHVSLDGTKVQANASKHKAMSYARMQADEQRLREEIEALMARAERQDVADDERLGAGVAEVDLPVELQRRQERLERIQAAKAALEEEARAARAAQLREQAERARRAARQADDEAERVRAQARAEHRERAAAAMEADAPAQADDSDEEEPPALAGLPKHAPKVTRDGLGRKIYQRRKCIPEAVFGQIKQAMGFRRFSMRGMRKVKGEWALVCTCHNVRKL